MALVVGNMSETIMLSYILNKSTYTSENLTIRLFSNDHIPVEADVVADYTEVSGGGYASVALNSALWVVAEGDPSDANYPVVTWIFTGTAGLIYGYYVTRTSGELMWAERFNAAPYNMQNADDEIRISPRLALE